MNADLSDSNPVAGVVTPAEGETAPQRSQMRRQWVTCGGCSNRWTGNQRAHCAAAGCHRTFSSITSFDRHRSRRGEHGSCLHPESVGLVERGGVWGMPPPDPTKVDLSFWSKGESA